MVLNSQLLLSVVIFASLGIVQASLTLPSLIAKILNSQLSILNIMEQLRNAGFAITICDKEGKILDMNARSKQTFAKYGDIIGHSLFEFHPPRAAEILRGLLENHNVNAYTIEKEGLHKLIYQVPWFEENGDFGGYVELSLVIPAEMPHYVR